MATVAGIKIKTKVAKPRGGAFADEKYTGSEPVWDTERAEKFDNETFDHCLRKSFYYYNYYYSQKDCKKHVVEWMQAQPTVFTKRDISAFIRSPDRSLSMTACSLIMAHRVGMPFRGRHIEFITDCINKSIELAEPEVVETAEEKPKAYVPTIQDRLNEKTSETIGELEGHYDEVIKSKDYKFKTYDFLVANNVPQSQLSKYVEVYQKRFDELKLAYEKADEQVVEGYKHYKAADFKRIFVFLDSILNDIEQYRGVKKATKKLRAPRAVSKEKVVAKLKYAKEDKALKIISINPVDILGANELWIYNSKTRKLGKYVADSLQGPLRVKGTSIEGYDEAKSVCKTLRKPIDQLKEFAKAGKIQLRKFLDEIKATETKLNGRINADIVLLKTQ
jgi:hypothetical protein